MKNTLPALLFAGLSTFATLALASPAEDLTEFREYYQSRFPNVDFAEFANGVYAIDEASREQWQEIEEFPPYELNLSKGEQLFKTPFANGKGYADCFENGGIGIRQNFPYFDTDSGEVVTLEKALNDCRVENGEAPLKYKKGPIADLSAYMAYTSRGKVFDIKVPDDPRAVAAFERGKTHFYTKRGQLNMACADCHRKYTGFRIRTEILSPALGQPTHFPVYRSKWGGLGTLHRRYAGCNQQVRAESFAAQSEEYRALEYFHTYMSNGLAVNGPGSRK